MSMFHIISLPNVNYDMFFFLAENTNFLNIAKTKMESKMVVVSLYKMFYDRNDQKMY